MQMAAVTTYNTTAPCIALFVDDVLPVMTMMTITPGGGGGGGV